MPPHNQKGTWKPCFDVSFRHIFVFDLLDKFYIVRENCHNPNNESDKNGAENFALSAAALNKVRVSNVERVSNGGGRNLKY